MKAARKVSTLVLMILLLAGIAAAQDQGSGNLAEKQKAPTVLGGTGLFNTFSTRTLCKGEFNFAVFWNNFDRDPGDLSINQVPFNITVGLTNRWEVWADWVTWQQTTSRNPFLLSGYQLSAVRFFGNPLTLLAPISAGRTAGFAGTGAGVGGILPTPGRFGVPIGFPQSFFSPGGPSGPPVTGLGPAFVTDHPNYYNELPFFGQITFVGFDSSGRPVFGPRESSNGTSDIYLGTKVGLISPDKHWFSMAVGGYLKIPISETDQARSAGRTSGVFEGGPMLIFGQEFDNHRVRFYENAGYIHTGNINEGNLQVLDLRDKVLLNAGLSVGVNKHIEFLSELAGTLYIANGTPSLESNNPVDLNVGARFYLRNGSISFGGAYRRFLNPIGDQTLQVANVKLVLVPPPFFRPQPFPPTPLLVPDQGSDNGFVAYLSIGRRKSCPAPPAPTCVLEAAPSAATKGDPVKLNAKPSTPGYQDSQVTYEYHWDVKDAQGQSVAVGGTGASVEVATATLACGNYTVTSTVTAKVPMVNCPSDCVTTGQTSCTTSFTISEAPCPPVSCEIAASPAQARMPGERVTLTATGHGEGNLSYSWSTSAGTLSATTGSEVTLDTTGVPDDTTINITLNTSTDRQRCGEACPGGSCSLAIPVGRAEGCNDHPVTPCGPLFFPLNNARIDNQHKACLDDIALKMQQDPRSSLVIDGHRDSKERVGISLTRANNARDYLVNEKGIDSARITVRNFGDTCPYESGDQALNRRVELWYLAGCAKMADIPKKCAAGATPQELKDEQPAVSDEHHRPAKRRRHRAKRPEPVIMMVQP
ncbi:MAG TPA: OmpA family protein [Blastocatellia bacterium]|nr:OmpA family protein [Blastocatellia bacterium]